MDGGDEAPVEDAVIHREWITPDNINQLFAKHNVPKAFDLLSIDLDGNDYWVLQALDYQPRVIVAEYNGNLPPDQRLTIKEDPEHVWDGGDYYGASLLALADLLAERGYLLVYCNGAGVNAFFVHRDFVGNLEPRPVADVYRRANYWYRGGRQFPDLGRTMVNLDSTS